MKGIAFAAMIATAISALPACGSSQRTVAMLPERSTQPLRQASPAPTVPLSERERGRIAVDASIREACGISDLEAYFAYDSADIDPKHRGTLRKLADCFTSGKLRGRSMLLVGHADPRGDDAYNIALGGRRADSVKKLLMNEGLSYTLAQSSSRGEMDARGTHEAEWERERRVDVMLAD